MKRKSEKAINRAALLIEILSIIVFVKQQIDKQMNILNFIWSKLALILIILCGFYLFYSYVENKLFVNKTMMKYILFKNRYQGLFDTENRSLESINLPREFSSKEIEILIEEKLINYQIQ